MFVEDPTEKITPQKRVPVEAGTMTSWSVFFCRHPFLRSMRKMSKSTFDSISPRFGMNIQRLQVHHQVMTYWFSVNIPRNGYQILITLPQKHDPNQLGETNSLKQSTIIIQWCPCNLHVRGFLIKVTWFDDPWNHSLCFYTETFRQKGYRPRNFQELIPEMIPYWKRDRFSKAHHSTNMTLENQPMQDVFSYWKRGFSNVMLVFRGEVC